MSVRLRRSHVVVGARAHDQRGRVLVELPPTIKKAAAGELGEQVGDRGQPVGDDSRVAAYALVLRMTTRDTPKRSAIRGLSYLDR